jgi:hypothetical protein
MNGFKFNTEERYGKRTINGIGVIIKVTDIGVRRLKILR